MSNNIRVKVEGGGEHIGQGYLLKRGDGVVAFFVDVISPKFFRFDPWARGVDYDGFPCVHGDFGEQDHEAWTISFPEYKGWSVHAVEGGKNLSVCLTKDDW